MNIEINDVNVKYKNHRQFEPTRKGFSENVESINELTTLKLSQIISILGLLFNSVSWNIEKLLGQKSRIK